MFIHNKKNSLAKTNLRRKNKAISNNKRYISEWISRQNTCGLTFFGACISNNETNCDAFMVLHQCFISSQSHPSFIARRSAAFLFILALTHEKCCQVPPWYLSEVWRRVKWGLTDIWDVKERGRTTVGVGQMLARLCDYVPLLCSACRVWLVQDFDKFGKSCHFLTGAWPQWGWSYQNGSVSRGVTSLRLNKRGGMAIK